MAKYTKSKAVMLPDGQRISLWFEMNWLSKGDNLVVFYENKKTAVFYRVVYDKKEGGLKCKKKMCWLIHDGVPLFIRNSDFLEVLTEDNMMLRSVYEYGDIKRYKTAGQKEKVSDKQYILSDDYDEEPEGEAGLYDIM